MTSPSDMFLRDLESLQIELDLLFARLGEVSQDISACPEVGSIRARMQKIRRMGTQIDPDPGRTPGDLFDTPIEVYREVSAEAPSEALSDISWEVLSSASYEVLSEAPIDAPSNAPPEAPIDAPPNAPPEAPIDAPPKISYNVRCTRLDDTHLRESRQYWYVFPKISEKTRMKASR